VESFHLLNQNLPHKCYQVSWASDYWTLFRIPVKRWSLELEFYGLWPPRSFEIPATSCCSSGLMASLLLWNSFDVGEADLDLLAQIDFYVRSFLGCIYKGGSSLMLSIKLVMSIKQSISLTQNHDCGFSSALSVAWVHYEYTFPMSFDLSTSLKNSVLSA